MEAIVSYQLADSVATVTMDDGKVNVLSPAMLAAVNDSLDRAAADSAVLVLTGRPSVFSAGFDLRVLTAGGDDAYDMLRGGFELAERLLSFPTPVVIACGGHALAMGSFLLLSGDYRIGADGDHKIGANEVAIGMTVPLAAIEICRQRLAPAHFSRALVLAEIYGPGGALAAGFLDEVVPAANLAVTAAGKATQLAKLDMKAHASTKLRCRAGALRAIREAIETDDATLRQLARSSS